VTPANMVFGRELRLPYDLMFEAPGQGTIDDGLYRRPGGKTTRYSTFCPPASESGQRPNEGTL